MANLFEVAGDVGAATSSLAEAKPVGDLLGGQIAQENEDKFLNRRLKTAQLDSEFCRIHPEVCEQAEQARRKSFLEKYAPNISPEETASYMSSGQFTSHFGAVEKKVSWDKLYSENMTAAIRGDLPTDPNEILPLFGDLVKDPRAGAAAKMLASVSVAARTRLEDLASGKKEKEQQSKDEACGLADEIIAGRQSPVTTGLWRNAIVVKECLAHKKFDLAKAQMDWIATTAMIKSVNAPQQVRLRQAATAIPSILGNIKSLYEQWAKLDRSKSGFSGINRVALEASKRLPGEPGRLANLIEAQITDLSSELAQIYTGGYAGTNESLKLAERNLHSDWNKQTFESALEQIEKNVQYRINAIYATAPVGVQGPPYYTPPPNPGAAGKGNASPTDPKVTADYLLQKFGIQPHQ